MDKSCHSSADSTTTATAGDGSFRERDQYLNHLNKISHKISKPPPHSVISSSSSHFRKQPSSLDHRPQPQTQIQLHPPPPQQLQPQNQPPVYNINKNDFRDVVQRLTGSPAHERSSSSSSSSSSSFSAPPPIHPPKPPSSRLQRIRPPPLGQITNRPPPLLNNPAPPPPSRHVNDLIPLPTTAAPVNFNPGQRQLQPLSPLPPFPTVHAAAESPISAYMRFLKNSISASDTDQRRFNSQSPLAPQLNNTGQPQQPLFFLPTPSPPPQQHPNIPQNPLSPLPFGCFPSPRSPCPLLSPSLLFSPTGSQLGFQQLPLSPTLPVLSPNWKKGL